MPTVTINTTGRQNPGAQMIYNGPCTINSITAPAGGAKVTLFDDLHWERNYTLGADETLYIGRPALSAAKARVGTAGVIVDYTVMSTEERESWGALWWFFQRFVVIGEEPWPHGQGVWNERSLERLPAQFVGKVSV